MTTIHDWIPVKERLPQDGQTVMAHYKGVYDYRLVYFWLDGGNQPHFGGVDEPDGRGSQPATHWMELPELP